MTVLSFIFLVLIFCVQVEYSRSKHSLVKESRTCGKVYKSTNFNNPHYHVFFNGNKQCMNKSGSQKSAKATADARRGLIGKIFSKGKDLGILDPLLESSRHYTFGIPFHLGGTSMFPQLAKYEITDFVFRMCDDGVRYPIHFDYFEPEFPLRVPGHVKVNFNATFNHDLIAPIEVAFEGYKGVFGAMLKWPCTFGLGSCIYHDFCQIFRYDETGGCPRGFKEQHIPCECPFPIGRYLAQSLDYSVFLNGVPEIPGPSVLVDGPYFGRMKFKKHGETLMCAEASMHVTSRRFSH